MLGRGERATIEDGGLDVRELLPGPLACDERVLVRLRVLVGMEEVQREELGVLRELARVEALVCGADTRVKLATAAEREPFVCGVAEERVSEAEPARRIGVALDELVQAIPRLRVGRRRRVVAGEHAPHELAAERAPHHGGVAEQRSIRGREPVDSRRDDGLDVLRKAPGGLAVRGGEELLQEERIASGPLDDRCDLLRAPAVRAGRVDQRPGRLDGQGFEVQRERGDRRNALGRDEAACSLTPRHADEPRLRRHLSSEMAQQMTGRLVHPVDVLDHEHRRARQQLREQRLDHAVEPRSPECRLEIVDLRRRLEFHVERKREQRYPLHDLLGQGRDPAPQPSGEVPPVAVDRDFQQRAEQAAEGVVRRRQLVLLARGANAVQVGVLRQQLFDQPRLPHPGVADELDQRPEAHPNRCEGCAEDGKLALAADEGRRRRCGALPAAGDRTDVVRDNRGLLALDVEGRQLDGLERRARALDDVGVREDRALPGLRHQSGGECSGLAHDRVRLAERRTHLAGEDAATVDSSVEPEPQAHVGDLPHRPEHPFLVVARRLGRACDEDDPDSVLVDIRLQEADAMLVGRLLDGSHGLVERLRGSGGTLLGQQRVGSGKAEEGHRRLPVLGLDGMFAQVVADRARNTVCEREPGDVRHRRDAGARDRDVGLQQPAARLLLAQIAGRQRSPRCGADQDLPRFCRVLQRNRLRDLRPAHEQLPMGSADQEEPEGAGV